METNKSIELIENMFNESKKSFYNNSFYFILWGIILALAGLIEHFTWGMENHWMVWPAVSTIGGLVSAIYGIREGKRHSYTTTGDRIIMLIWVGFLLVMVYAITYALYNHMTPHALIMIATAYATFLTGGVSRFKPLLFGGLALLIGSVLAGFVFPMKDHGLLFSITIVFGYLIPGILLRRSENG